MDTTDGLVITGPTVSLRVRYPSAQRFGLCSEDIATAVNTALLGQPPSFILEGNRVVTIRVQVDPDRIKHIAALRELPLPTPAGQIVKLS